METVGHFDSLCSLLLFERHTMFTCKSDFHFCITRCLKDKATVEMECMEEGYLAKIVRGDGSSGIKVGEVFI